MGNIFKSLERGIRHTAHKTEKALRKPVKMALPIAGSILGNMYGGPLGGMIGGSLGSGLSSKHHKLDHMLGGAAAGLLGSSLMGGAGRMMGLNPDSGFGQLSGMNHSGLLEQLGFGGGGGGLLSHGLAAKTPGFLSGRGNNAGQQESGYSGGDDPNSFNWSQMKEWIDPALLAIGVGGQLLARPKKQHQPTMAEQYDEMQAARARHEGPVRRVKPLKRKKVNPEDRLKNGFDYSFYDEVNPETEYYARGGYANGGHVEAPLHLGYVKGASGGTTDDVHAHIPNGSYVMDATTVSLLGDGNSDNGAEKLREMEEKFLRGGFVRNYPTSENIRAKISTGEYVMHPDTIAALGKGDGDKGAKQLDAMRKRLRSQKGVKTFLPPKAKPITHYMR